MPQDVREERAVGTCDELTREGERGPQAGREHSMSNRRGTSPVFGVIGVQLPGRLEGGLELDQEGLMLSQAGVRT